MRRIGGRVATTALAGAIVALTGAFIGTVGGRPQRSGSATPPAPVIRIVATDYAFVEVPPTVRHGLTYFSFKNAGKVRHEMSLLRLEAGVGVSDVIQNAKMGGKGRAKLFKTVGLLIEPPGGSTIGWLAMELKKGETYVLICTLRDKPEAQQHYALGMYSAFTVR